QRLPPRQRLILDQRQDGFLSFEEEMAKPAAPVDPPALADDAQAFQPYTSGSTGRPKGAIMRITACCGTSPTISATGLPPRASAGLLRSRSSTRTRCAAR